MIQQAHLYVSQTRILHFIQINVANPTLVAKRISKTKKLNLNQIKDKLNIFSRQNTQKTYYYPQNDPKKSLINFKLKKAKKQKVFNNIKITQRSLQ